MSTINDIDLKNWKNYNEIFTDSLWVLDRRDNSGVHSSGYWGNFIPQIPNQILKRYTKKGDWVLDPFLGSGTTLIEFHRLGRNGIGIDLQENIIKQAKNNIAKEKHLYSHDITMEIVQANSIDYNYSAKLQELQIEKIQLAILHPPYWDIIHFSKDKEDLSNLKNLEDFLTSLRKLVNKIYFILEKNRYLVVVMGDKYSSGEWLPLGFYVMQEVMKENFKLKSIVVKNFEETKGKRNQKSLWKYRALAGGFYLFKHEYIFLFQRK